MAKYRRKPIEVEAVRFGVDTQLPDWFIQKMVENVILSFSNGTGYVKTSHGGMTVKKGDYIIRVENGEVYPCEAQMFERNYVMIEQKV